MRRSTIALAAIVAVGAAAIACGGASPDVKLGAIISLTGQGAGYGTSIRKGVDLAVEQINAAGGIDVHEQGPKPITMDIRDAESSSSPAATAAHELLDEGVVAVVGADLSDITLDIAPIFQAAEVILLSPSSSSPKISDAGDFIFRNFPSDELEALNTADYIYNKLGIREAAVVANQNEFGIGQKNSFIERFRQLGGRVDGQASYPRDATDFSSVVQEIAGLGMPAIYIAGYTADTVGVARALRAARVKAALFATGAVQASELRSQDEDAVEGLVFPQPSFDAGSDDDNVRAFVTAFSQKYGHEPDVYAAHGYDAVKILAEAVQEAGLDPHEIRFYLNSMNPYAGVSGTTDFNDKGDVRKFHRMYRIESGQAVPIPELTGAPGAK